MRGVYFESGENFNINKCRKVKVTSLKNGDVEIQDSISHRVNYLRFYKKKDKFTYIDTRTGELLYYNISETKSVDSIKKSMRKLKKILKNNFFR